MSASSLQSGASAEELRRYLEVETGIGVFSSILGSIIAHETGHLVGLVAHGPTPAGLFGGSTGAKTDHNVTPSGQTPAEHWLMNAGSSFSFDEIAGRNGQPLPAFRPLNYAYLHDRIVLDQQVTGLYPPPVLTQVTPDPAVYPAGQYTTAITVEGTDFLATPVVQLLRQGSPTWDSLLVQP